MRSAILLIGALAASAIGLAMPNHDNDANLFKRFDIPGASVEEGFTIPEDTPEGLYSVYIDDAGVAHHTMIKLSEEEIKKIESRSLNGEPIESSLLERQLSWKVTCDGSFLDREDADITVRALKLSCGNGQVVGPRVHYYAYYGRVVSFVCNHTTTGDSWICTSDMVEEQIQGRISNQCGAYRGGWSRYGNRLSLGSQLLNRDKSFCGTSH